MKLESGHPTYLLKIFSGPHLGAEIFLTQPDMSLGRDPDCDIVLSDHLLSERHLRIMIRENNLVILRETEAGSIWVNGQPVQAGETLLNNFDMIIAGTTCFCIGPLETRWPRIEIPAVLPEEAEASPDQTESTDDSASKSLPMATVRWGNLEIRKRSLVLISFLVFFITAVAGVMLFYPKPDQFPRKTSVTSAESMENRLRSAGFPNVLIRKSDNRKWEIGGYVAVSPEKTRLIRIVRDEFPDTLVQVHVMDQLLEACRETAAGMHIPVEISDAGMGNIRLTGFVISDERRKRLLEMIQQEIPGIRNLEDRILSPETIRMDLTRLIEQAGLTGRIRTTLFPNYILAEGKIPDHRMSDWHYVTERYTARYGKYMLLKESIIPEEPNRMAARLDVPAPEIPRAAPSSDHIDIGVRAIGFGPVRYVRTETGITCFEGGILPNGYRILSIQPTQVIVNKNGDTKTYRFWR